MSAYEIEEVRDIEAAWADLCGLFLGLYHHHGPNLPPLVEGWERRWRSHLAGPQERLLLLGRVEGEAVGFMNSRINRDSGLYRETFAFVEDAYVETEHRGSGLAQALLERTEAWCWSKRIDLLRLNVHVKNDLGMHFWDKSGFEPMMHIVTKTLSGAPS